jgi:hypothetical protein
MQRQRRSAAYSQYVMVVRGAEARNCDIWQRGVSGPGNDLELGEFCLGWGVGRRGRGGNGEGGEWWWKGANTNSETQVQGHKGWLQASIPHTGCTGTRVAQRNARRLRARS